MTDQFKQARFDALRALVRDGRDAPDQPASPTEATPTPPVADPPAPTPEAALPSAPVESVSAPSVPSPEAVEPADDATEAAAVAARPPSEIERFQAALALSASAVTDDGERVASKSMVGKVCARSAHKIRAGDVLTTNDRGETVIAEESLAGERDAECHSFLGALEETMLALDGRGAQPRTVVLDPDLVDPNDPNPVLTAQQIERILAQPPAGSGLPRRTCWSCGMTFRRGERVVVCPCGGGCYTLIHHDPGNGRPCFATQFPDGVATHCLTTSKALSG